jgi:hypothetical protein
MTIIMATIHDLDYKAPVTLTPQPEKKEEEKRVQKKNK